MNEHAHILEQIMDHAGVAGLLEMLAEICGEKASHLESNWQDQRTAKLWDKVGNELLKVANGKSVANLNF